MSYLEVYECDFCQGRVERKVSWSHVSEREGIPTGWDTIHGKWMCKACAERMLGVSFPIADRKTK
jgi:hypothetical protein